MVYLNQAATTFPKPAEVLKAVSDTIANPPQGQFRSSSASEDIFALCKRNLGRLLGVSDYSRIIFTSGATAAANALFYGLDFGTGKIALSQTEHNSILRPAKNLSRISENVIIPCNEIGKIDAQMLDDILEKEKNVNTVFINHCSNVTGYIQNITELTKVCHSHGARIIVDLSQSAGNIPINVDESEIDGFVFAGHKGLFGIQGIGGYYLRDNIPLKPFMYGGTGLDSKRVVYENEEDYEYEVGTGNEPGVAGLNAGVEFIIDKQVNVIRDKELTLMNRLYQGLEAVEGVRLFVIPEDARGPVASFTIDGLKNSDVAYILQNGYEITVRTGLHCAPLIHKAMGTYPEGTVRISVSYFNDEEDIDAVVSAVKDMSASINS